MKIVTGAARGIGKAIAHRLAAEGEPLVLVDLAPTLAETALEIEALGVEVRPVQVDLTSEDGPAAVAEACGSDGVSLLVNNAGITRDARLVNMTEDDFRLVLDVNLGSVYHLSQAIRPLLTEGSAIVNLASRAYLGNFGQYNYSMSKGAVVGLTRAMSIELAPRTRVNAIAPGLIGTEMALGIPDEIRERMISAIPMARMGEPSEVAELVTFLGSERSGYITGHVVVIGGGRSLT